MITMATARRVTAEFCAVAGQTIAYKAIFTETREGLTGKGVASFLQLQAGGFIMTQITASDKCPCKKYSDSLIHAGGF